MNESGSEMNASGDDHRVRGATDPHPSWSRRPGRGGDLREFLAGTPRIGETELLDLLGTDQVERWRAGKRIPAEAYLALHPTLLGDPEVAFELVYGEFLIRESLGETPSTEEFSWRFPAFADRLLRQLELHEALRDEGDDDPMATVAAPVSEGEGEAEAAAPGPDVPGYRILGELGKGGMGVVYRARQLSLNRIVAVKILSPGAYADPDAAARFRAEAEAAARFQHPNIVQIHEVGEDRGLGFIALEYVSGGNLQQRLASTPQDPRESARVIEVLARTIDEAHRRGIIHRDLKPANILLTEDGVPKITDFGLAKLLEREEGPTRAGAIMGTPSYMAPEQIAGLPDAITAATDVYALGAILYEMLTGRPPFQGSTPLSTLEQVSTQDPLPPGKFQRHTPRDLETICLKCLEKEPRRRYPGAMDLADDLRRFLDGRPIAARPTPAWETAWKWARRRPSIATALAATAIAMVILIAGGLYYNTLLHNALQSADANARNAYQQRNLALNALSELVFGVQEQLGETPENRPLRHRLLDTATAGLDRIARSAEVSAPDLSRAVAHQKLGEIFREVGRRADARRQLVLARRLAEDLAAARPRDPAVADCLSRAYIGLGELSIRGGEPAEAVTSYHRLVGLAERFAQANPGHPGARRGLLEAYLQLGRALGFAGRLAEADVWFHKTRDLADRWRAAEPDNVVAQEMLAWSYRKLADMRKLSHDPDAARVEYQKAIAIVRELVKAAPGNATYQNHLAVTLDDLAGVVHRRGGFAEARALFTEAERTFNALAGADPENLELQLRLIRAEEDFARRERDQGEFAGAADLFGRSSERLLALRRAGKLEGRPDWRRTHLNWVRSEVDYCKAAPAALDDLAFARAQPARLASRLLLLRIRTFSAKGVAPAVVAAAEALNALEADAPDDLYELAHCLAACLGPLATGPLEPDRRALADRCADRAVAVLAQAVERARSDRQKLVASADFAPLRQHPGYRALRDRLKTAPPSPPRSLSEQR